MNYCENGDYNGGEFKSDEVYKELPDSGRVYAYYYYYDEDRDVGVDAPTQINVDYYTVMNFIVNKDGIITQCKYKRFFENAASHLRMIAIGENHSSASLCT